MPSSPAVPKRLGPRFAAVNDVDRDVEEALGLDPEPEVLNEEIKSKGVDEEIDELLSDTEEQVDMPVLQPTVGSGKPNAWTCKWEDCFRDQDSQEILVEHLQTDHIGQGREAYVCLWDDCPRKGQKQATRHSLITHCRAHTGERPYTCTEPECGKTFTRSDALTKHLRSLHNITPEMPPRKKGKDQGAAHASSPPQSPLVQIKRKNDIDDAISEVLPLSPAATTTSIAAPGPITAPVKAASKAKPRRSRAKTQKDKDKEKAGPSQSTTKSDTRMRNFPLPLSTSSAFYDHAMNQVAFDEDLGPILPRLCERTTFWEDSDDDEPALDLIRARRARERREPPYGVEEDDYDSLDEMIPAMGEARVVGETELPGMPDAIVPVMSRSKWQARFLMAKAKVMLLAEENEMRRKELETTMNEEIELDKQLSKRLRMSTK